MVNGKFLGKKIKDTLFKTVIVVEEYMEERETIKFYGKVVDPGVYCNLKEGDYYDTGRLRKNDFEVVK